MWNRQLQMVGHAKVTCKRSGNRLPSFSPHSLLFSTSGASAMTPKVPMGPQTCWKSCGTPPSRSWTLRSALKFPPLRGKSCVVPAGPIWEKQISHGASSCKLRCDVWPVRIEMFFFSNVKGHCHGWSLETFGNIDRPKMWNRQLQMVGLAQVTCKRSGNRLPSFYPHSLFWALQVLRRWHQRCRWGRRPAGSLAELSPGEVELCVLLSNSVHCVAEAAWCQLDQFERSRFLMVPRLANFVAMFGQFG